MGDRTLDYHARTFELLGRTPVFSDAAQATLAAREAALGVRFPDAVSEWYSLDGAVEILAEFGNADRPVPIEQLGESERARALLAQGLLVIMDENQAVCTWAVQLASGDDPPVLVLVESSSVPSWQPYCETFSLFTYTQAWDWTPGGRSLAAQDRHLNPKDLAYLRAEFDEAPQTRSWPARVTYRFEADGGRLLIWDDEDKQADWWLWGTSEAALLALARRVWHLAGLAETLYSLDERGEAVLDALDED